MEKAPLPEYKYNLFVDREEEIGKVMKKVESLPPGLSQRERLLIFTGERGTGKSWLLRHLEKELKERGTVDVFFLDLATFWDQEPLIAVIGILKKAAEEILGQNNLSGKSLRDMTGAFLGQLRRRLEERPLVVLIDTVYESPRPLLVEVESYFIAPLANEPRVLIVMAGRGKPYQWRAPEVRLNLKEMPLKGFEEEEYIREQVKKQVRKPQLDDVSKIKEWGDGVPLVNYLLAEYGEEGLDRALDLMLELVGEDERGRVREVVERVCVLRAFDAYRIVEMFTRSEESIDQGEAERLLDLLVENGLADFRYEVGGYVLDEPVRVVAERYLEVCRYEQWRALHCAAYRMYGDWANKYSRSREWWKKEREYHEHRLRERGETPEDCPLVSMDRQRL